MMAVSLATKAIASVVAVSGFGSGAWVGGIQVRDYLDERYAPMQVVDDLAWTTMKGEIRRLRQLIEDAESATVREQLEEDLQDTIDRFCKNYPEDRECRKE